MSKLKRIAFYIRVSTEEQASNPEGSIKNQEDRLHQMVKLKNMDSAFGEVTEIFIDRGKSGKDTKRAELQRLLDAIRLNKIDLLMTTELSRISRSIRDFSEIWEMMQKHNCGLMCLRENFDTETAAGEMVLYTLANIAQFERKQVSERVAANIKARSKRGLYNGGPVPIGYKLIDGRPGYLEVDKEQAKNVGKAFEAFITEGTLSKTARWLNDNGFRLKRHIQGGGRFMRSNQFTVDNLHSILTNPTYIGLKKYKDNGEEKTTKAVWSAIVNEDLFNRVDEILKKNKYRKKPHSKIRYPYLLSGITFCSACGDHLSGKSAHGKTKKIGYYEHSWRTKRNSNFSKKQLSCENFDRVPASKLEEIVCFQMEKLLNDETLAKDLIMRMRQRHKENSEEKEARSLKAKISGVKSQLDALAERLSELPKSVSAAPIFKQMEKLTEHKELYEKQLEAFQVKGGLEIKPIELRQYQALLKTLREFWKNGDSETKSKIIQWLIHRIDVGKDSVTIHYQLIENELVRESVLSGSRPFGGDVSEFKKFFVKKSSNSLTNGAQ
ncbi:MAG: recombinase family protein [Bdellovibrionales bacterium]|nr:recombinase family protein [Bdellovibrionales bacterium]MCB0412803.1 recombinase family protein [Bdellovibrionales bacterium]